LIHQSIDDIVIAKDAKPSEKLQKQLLPPEFGTKQITMGPDLDVSSIFMFLNLHDYIDFHHGNYVVDICGLFT
jgi:hypothetical protein